MGEIHNLGKNWLSIVLEIWKAIFGDFIMVSVNNTLVCCASFFIFLVADTQLHVLINILNAHT